MGEVLGRRNRVAPAMRVRGRHGCPLGARRRKLASGSASSISPCGALRSCGTEAAAAGSVACWAAGSGAIVAALYLYLFLLGEDAGEKRVRLQAGRQQEGNPALWHQVHRPHSR